MSLICLDTAVRFYQAKACIPLDFLFWLEELVTLEGFKKDRQNGVLKPAV